MTGTSVKDEVSERILGAVGLAVRARACVVGTTLSVEKMRADKGELLITACDISENTRKRLIGKQYRRRVGLLPMRQEKSPTRRRYCLPIKAL